MRADNKYFTVAVHLADAEKSIKEGRDCLETGLAGVSMAHIRSAMKKLADAAEELFKAKTRPE